jgi:threonine dehydrogenase-like Zn-dependent dehydrogenase
MIIFLYALLIISGHYILNTSCSAAYGYSHLAGAVPGGQAEYVRVAYADWNCFPIPEDVPDQKALYLTDIIPTGLHAAKLGDVSGWMRE